MSSIENETPSTSDWLERINEQEFAALTATVRRVQSLVGDESSSLAQLSEVLQLDPNLAVKLLRIANSPSYMMTPDPITTVTRATTLIGYDAIRNICLTSRLLETLLADQSLSEGVSARLLRRTAASLHAGIQARMMMGGAPSREREEAFLAALLEQIGESAFWSLGGGEVEQLHRAMEADPDQTDGLIKQRLGCGFLELSTRLTESWGLGKAAIRKQRSPHASIPDEKITRLANEIADCVASEGWQSSDLKSLQRRVAAVMNLSEQEAGLRMRACGNEAEELAHCYGAGILARHMRYKSAVAETPAPSPAPATARRNGQSADTSEHGSSAVQLSVLREMMSMMSGNTDINTVIKTAIDGVQRGIGMDRTITALVSEDRRSLKMRFCQGDGNEHWSKAFRFEIPPRKSILSECVQGNASFRYDAANPGTLAKLIPVELMRFCEGKDFVLTPMLVGTRSIGVFYADRAQSDTPITQEDFDSFSHFSQQLSMCLAAITKRKN